jgi:hypothetical protein
VSSFALSATRFSMARDMRFRMLRFLHVLVSGENLEEVITSMVIRDASELNP